MTEMRDLGPVEVLAVGFEADADFRGGIIDELDALEQQGVIRVLDLLFLAENERTNELHAVDYRGDELGAVVSGLLGFPFADEATTSVVVQVPPVAASVGVSREQLSRLVRDAPPDIAMAFLLIEHVWARTLKRSISDAGGALLAEGFLSADALESIGTSRSGSPLVAEELRRAIRASGTGASTSADASAGSDYVGELERLARLHTQGVLTNAEYEAKKRRVLGI